MPRMIPGDRRSTPMNSSVSDRVLAACPPGARRHSPWEGRSFRISMSFPRPHLLPRAPELPADLIRRVRSDHDQFARDGLPDDLEDHLRRTYGLDVMASYAGTSIRNP